MQRLRVEIEGAVQGVGFRPFVYRLATEEGLRGWVLNDSAGVELEVEGERAVLERFLGRLASETPPRATVQQRRHTWLEPTGYQGFVIRHSDGRGAKTVQVLPDIATCPDCLRELRDPQDRRHGYAFLNCTNCGPRFTIVRALPYDRPNTTMAGFPLCPACRAEYEAPLDRRFHAQPTACAACGPGLVFFGRPRTIDQGPSTKDHRPRTIDYRPSTIDQGLSPHAHAASSIGPPPPSPGAAATGLVIGPSSLVPGGVESKAPLAQAVAALRAGKIVAVKGLGGFHLMVDAGNAAAVDELRRRKRRGGKPFALMVRDLAMAAAVCALPAGAADLLAAPEAPILLLPRRADAPVAPGVAPGNPSLGVMLPATPLHHLLLAELDRPLVATSGNLSDEPICTDEAEAAERLAGVADAFLSHNRPIARHADDSVATVMLDEPRLLRRARGYAPAPVLLRHALPCILGVGAQLKNSVALSVGRQVVISQHIGDLEGQPAREAFQRVIADLLRLYEARPEAVAHDLHPGYYSTEFARASGQTPWHGRERQEVASLAHAIGIQHHHAHLAACLAEHQAEGPALGVIWDGTGYGPDGTIWGGEFLLGDVAGSARAGHLLAFPLPGGDSAVREPRRSALGMLYAMGGPAALAGDDLPPLAAFQPGERALLRQMIERGVNTLPTSSAGRLFDGAAALLGLCQQASYEGEAAMALEYLAHPAERGAYPIDLGDDGVLDWRPAVAALIAERRRGVDPALIAARLHNALVDGIVRAVRRIDPPQVALSGGCFQNRRLTEHTARALMDAGYPVLLHRQVPPNDGGISLGQVAAAAEKVKGKS